MPKLKALYSSLGSNPSKEPALNTGAALSSVAALLAILTQLFPHLLTDKQETIIYLVVALGAPIVTGLLIRGKVWSPASVLEIIDNAVHEIEDLEHIKPIEDIKPKNGI